MALTDSRKTLSLWTVNGNAFELIKIWRLSAKTELIIFTRDSSSMLVAGLFLSSVGVA